MDPVETRYVEIGDSVLAYQLIGSGPHEILVNHEINGHLDLMWTDPHTHAMYEHFAPLVRMVVMQRRGVGLSGPSASCPTVEQQADDVLAVMDAAGFERATLMGVLSTCAPVALVAARVPERVRNLLLLGPFATGAGSPKAAENGYPPERIPAVIEAMLHMVTHWGSGFSIDVWDADQANPYNRRLAGLMERASATPKAAMAHYDYLIGQDFGEIFAAVDVPTRVLAMSRSIAPESVSRRVAELIPGAELIAVPPTPRGAASGEAWRPIFDHLLELASGTVPQLSTDRRIGTVLFTDIVGSTRLLSSVGDVRYRRIRDQHERDVRLAVEQGHGRLINVIGDGTLSLFSNASDALACAQTICDQASEHQIQVRAAIHSGELEHTGMDITGMTVHVGARIAALADGGEVLVSRFVKDLLLGSDLNFEARGTHQLRGVDGRHDIYALSRKAREPDGRETERQLKRVDRVTLRLVKSNPRLVRSAVAFGNTVQRLRSTRAMAGETVRGTGLKE